ncbi:MAG: hypothetical protein HMLKMBBP_01464 [Planctomycetes bacterium]|nr:hypothetical protein [Planctomycetota bacterium]
MAEDSVLIALPEGLDPRLSPFESLRVPVFVVPGRKRWTHRRKPHPQQPSTKQERTPRRVKDGPA